MADFIPDDEARDRRLAAIRARRGTPERLAAIEALMASKAKEKEKARKSPSTGGGARKTPENSDSYFGHSWPFWFAMRDAGNEHIIECARERRTTTYADLWAAITASLGEELGNRWWQMGPLLGAMGEAAHEKDGIMPTALVMAEGDGETNPGPGFFRLAADMGQFPEDQTPPKGEPWTKMTETQRRFWEEQRDLVFAKFAPR